MPSEPIISGSAILFPKFRRKNPIKRGPNGAPEDKQLLKNALPKIKLFHEHCTTNLIQSENFPTKQAYSLAFFELRLRSVKTYAGVDLFKT